MSDEWLALRRVGEWAGLEGEQLSDYLSIVRPIHEDALRHRKEQGEGFAALRGRYFEFLNESVLSRPPVVDFVRNQGVDNTIVAQFESGDIPVRTAFRELNVVDYGLDDIVDFVMLLKLFKRYRELTDQEAIRPLENLHSLVYLVNYRLSEADSGSITDLSGFGMLEKTGYRYTFERRNGYAWSESLQRDQDRLFAWQILDRELIDEPQPEWELTYSVSLGEAAELFLTRFEARLNSFDSLLLREWEVKQNEVLEDLASSSKSGIASHLRSLHSFESGKEGEIVLNGRPKRFEDEQKKQAATIHD